MIRDRKPVRFVPNPLQKVGGGGSRRKRDGLRISREKDALLFLAAGLGQPDQINLRETQALQNLLHRTELTLAAVNHDQIGQEAAF